MADASPKQGAAKEGGDSGAPAAGKSKLQLVLGAVLATAIAGGLGSFFGLQIAGFVEEAVKSKDAAADKPVEVAYSGPTHLRPLAPIIANLAAPADTWVRVEASLVFADADAAGDEVLAAKVGEDILAYLRTTTLPQLEGASGIQYLHEDLDERAALRSDGRVREVVLQTLVVQ